MDLWAGYVAIFMRELREALDGRAPAGESQHGRLEFVYMRGMVEGTGCVFYPDLCPRNMAAGDYLRRVAEAYAEGAAVLSLAARTTSRRGIGSGRGGSSGRHRIRRNDAPTDQLPHSLGSSALSRFSGNGLARDHRQYRRDQPAVDLRSALDPFHVTDADSVGNLHNEGNFGGVVAPFPADDEIRPCQLVSFAFRNRAPCEPNVQFVGELFLSQHVRPPDQTAEVGKGALAETPLQVGAFQLADVIDEPEHRAGQRTELCYEPLLSLGEPSDLRRDFLEAPVRIEPRLRDLLR